ncbi:hypothetical protein LR48_Vigan11g108300 [Vigna angularis]|uniref:Uncharacterized protein n=1 Tax=Phaseolus angularis TaxID=3914 RepID=A0A0L9VSL3_PHAAN|nr:hypothetical protein LR48_Vigan11g108300 [Vigna angularis]
MCSALAITPTIPIFFHYFNVRPIAKQGWVSLTFVNDGCLFKPYSESLKNFKHRYFKVIIKEGVRSQFHTKSGGPLFRFYWTRDPAMINVVPVGAMTPIEIEAVKTIDALSCRLPDRDLVECLGHEDFDQMVFDIMSLPTHRKTSYLSSSRRRDPRSTGSSHALIGSQSRMMPQSDPPVIVATQPPPVVNLETFEAAVIPVATPLDKKRKSKEGEKSSSKKSRRDGNTPHPLSRGLFDPTFNVRGHVSFHMSSLQRAVVEPMLEKDITEAGLEFASWGPMLAWYLREFADRRSAGDVQAELVVEKKMVEDLRTQMDAVTLEHQECEKKRSTLPEKLNDADRLAGELVMADELGRANKAIVTLNNKVQIEHEKGFNKALCQAAFLLGVDPLAVGFDIRQDVYDDKMMPVNEEVADDEDVQSDEDDDE